MTEPTADGSDLPRLAQLTLDRSMAHFFCTLVGIGRAIHDEDEGRWNQRSKFLQMMLWMDTPIGVDGTPIDHNGFHRLEDAAFRVFKAVDPDGYKEAFGDAEIASESDDDDHDKPGDDDRPDAAIISLLEGFLGHKIGKVSVLRIEPKGGDAKPDPGPSSGRGPAKKARKRRGKDST